MFYDAPGRMLWLGHADGLISAFAVGATTGSSCDMQHVVHWQAHRMGAVTAITRTAAGDLWTGTSRGSLRMWAPEARQAAGGAPAVSSARDIAASARELRRPHGAKPHNSGVAFLVAPATGQVRQQMCKQANNQGQHSARFQCCLVSPLRSQSGTQWARKDFAVPEFVFCRPCTSYQHALVAGGVVMQRPVAAAVVCAHRRFLGRAAA